MTRVEYICVPPKGHKYKHPMQFDVNGYEMALKLVRDGWQAWIRTTTWEEIESE